MWQSGAFIAAMATCSKYSHDIQTCIATLAFIRNVSGMCAPTTQSNIFFFSIATHLFFVYIYMYCFMFLLFIKHLSLHKKAHMTPQVIGVESF
jgi:hypothetical protein